MKKHTQRLPIIILLVLNLFGFQLYGQDVTFTHFMQNPIYYNPASVGIDQGMLISLNYRRALMYLPSKFETIALGLDQSLHDTEIKGLGGMELNHPFVYRIVYLLDVCIPKSWTRFLFYNDKVYKNCANNCRNWRCK